MQELRLKEESQTLEDIDDSDIIIQASRSKFGNQVTYCDDFT